MKVMAREHNPSVLCRSNLHHPSSVISLYLWRNARLSLAFHTYPDKESPTVVKAIFSRTSPWHQVQKLPVPVYVQSWVL